MMKLVVLVLFALPVAACSGGGSSSGEVQMTDAQRFEPEELTVAAGETVTWKNESGESHTVTAYEDDIPDGADFFASGDASSEDGARDALDEGLIDGGETFEVTFDEPGTYRYFCIPHEDQGMVGTIVVEE